MRKRTVRKHKRHLPTAAARELRFCARVNDSPLISYADDGRGFPSHSYLRHLRRRDWHREGPKECWSAGEFMEFLSRNHEAIDTLYQQAVDGATGRILLGKLHDLWVSTFGEKRG